MTFAQNMIGAVLGRPKLLVKDLMNDLEKGVNRIEEVIGSMHIKKHKETFTVTAGSGSSGGFLIGGGGGMVGNLQQAQSATSMSDYQRAMVGGMIV